MIKRKKIKLKKERHSLDWFVSRVGRKIYKRVRIADSSIRKYITIESVQHARALFAHQNDHQISYFI